MICVTDTRHPLQLDSFAEHIGWVALVTIFPYFYTMPFISTNNGNVKEVLLRPLDNSLVNLKGRRLLNAGQYSHASNIPDIPLKCPW